MAKKKTKKSQIQPLDLKPLIKQISKEKDLDPVVIKDAVEAAILSAAQKRAKSLKDPRPILDIETGEMRLFVKKKVVVSVEDDKHEIDILSAKAQNPRYMLGQEVDVEIEPEEFGRIAAQSVRQGILQRLRDAERDRIYEDYKDKVGQVVTGIVQRYERRDVIVALGRVECLLPHQEMPMTPMKRRLRYGDRIRCLIVDVRRVPKGPQIILSRTRSDLVKQLFATEVPEISDGTVRIVEIAREPGIRTKVAVNSSDPNVDPVGACVGIKGQRVQVIVKELNDEKIDIVPYSPIPENFISSSLNPEPGDIVNIRLEPVEKRAEVTVRPGSLSRAIGKRGQNAKLAAKLTGWKIDIKEQEEAETLARIRELNRRYMQDFLSQISGLSEFRQEALLRSTEFDSVERLSKTDPERLLSFTDNDRELAEQIVEGAKDFLEGLEEMSAQEPALNLSEEDKKYLRKAEEMMARLSGRTVSVTPEDVVEPESPGDMEDAAAEEGESAPAAPPEEEKAPE